MPSTILTAVPRLRHTQRLVLFFNCPVCCRKYELEGDDYVTGSRDQLSTLLDIILGSPKQYGIPRLLSPCLGCDVPVPLEILGDEDYRNRVARYVWNKREELRVAKRNRKMREALKYWWPNSCHVGERWFQGGCPSCNRTMFLNLDDFFECPSCGMQVCIRGDASILPDRGMGRWDYRKRSRVTGFRERIPASDVLVDNEFCCIVRDDRDFSPGYKLFQTDQAASPVRYLHMRGLLVRAFSLHDWMIQFWIENPKEYPDELKGIRPCLWGGVSPQRSLGAKVPFLAWDDGKISVGFRTLGLAGRDSLEPALVRSSSVAE